MVSVENGCIFNVRVSFRAIFDFGERVVLKEWRVNGDRNLSELNLPCRQFCQSSLGNSLRAAGTGHSGHTMAWASHASPTVP